MAHPDILKGPIRRTLVVLAWPVIAGEGLHVAFHLVDLAWVRPLGTWATAAIMTAMFTLWTTFALVNLVAVGMTAHAARAIGAGEPDRAGRVVAQALWLAGGLSILVALGGALGARPLFHVLTSDPQVAEAGTGYLVVSALTMPLAFLASTLTAALRSAGNTQLSLRINGSAVVLNMGLAPLFIYGWGPFPAWGVAGSAVASSICWGGAAIAVVVLAWRRHPDLPLSREELRRPSLAAMGAIARVGAPQAGTSMLFSLVYLFYARLAGGFGAAGMALLGIGNRLESITYLTGDGVGVAAATFVGQNLGARDARRAEQGAWMSVRLMALVGSFMGLLMLVAPTLLLLPFTRDPETLRLGAVYIRIVGLCQAFTGIEAALGGAFAGAGDTLPPMLVHVVVSVLRVPAAWWAVHGLGLGIQGIAWSMALTGIARCAILAGLFARGRWKLRELAMPIPTA
jgi:putative MATE family efflux protein